MIPTGILDSAMGSELIKYGEILPEHIWSAKTNLTNPQLIYKIHKSHIHAGANYITTNTFRTTKRAFKKLGLSNNKATQLATESFNSALQMAHKASKGKVKILGSIAPLEDCYSPNLFPGKKIALREYEEIANLFSSTNIDCFLLETMTNITEIKSCLTILKNFNIPIWVSLNLLNQSEILSGESLTNTIKEVKKFPVDCILLNCNPLERTLKALMVLKKKWGKELGVYPNLGKGEPSIDGVINNYYSIDEFSNFIKKCFHIGINYIGGCCGANTDHIKIIKELIK